VANRLYRSRDERLIGGVAGGIAENLNVDPTIVRLGWVILALVAPITPLVYFVLIFVIPEEPDVTSAAGGSVVTTTASPNAPPVTTTRGGSGDRSAALIFGGLLVVVGAWFLVRPYLPRFDVGAYWPYLVIGLGVVLIVTALQRGRRDGE
jgi:phage shock protein C